MIFIPNLLKISLYILPTIYNYTMKAAVLFELNKPLRIIDLPVPEPEKGQVLVRMAASGICHTQLLEIAGKNAAGPMNPNLLGHEGSGIVEKVGEDVKKVKKGDNVILSWIKGSGANVLPKPYIYNGQKINAGYVTTFNEYSLASENRVTPITKRVPLKEAALIGCSVATGVGAVINNAKVSKDKSVMVIGVGGVGINIVHVSSLIKASHIIAVDINNEKLDFSKRFGATNIINSEEVDIEIELKKILGNNSLDFAFDTVGEKDTMELIYRSVNKYSGKAILCGVPTPLGLKIEIDPFPLYYGRQLVGTGGGESKPDVDFEKYCNMFLDKKLKLSDMITHVFPLEKINEGIDLLKDGKCCKVLIDFAKS